MIKPLTSLRFIFAFIVFLSHLDFLLQSKNETSRNLFKHILFEGYIGVSFFFILSGFILSYKYQAVLLKDKKAKKDFWRARFARIYPLHLLTLLLSLPLVFSEFFQNKIKFLTNFIINLTLTQSYFPQRTVHYAFNGPSWSISDEAFFYLVFPLVIFVFFKPIQNFYRLLFLAIIIVVTGLFVLPENWHHFVFYIFPPVRFVDFMIGMGLYNLYVYVRQHKPSVHMARWEWFSILLFGVFFYFHEQIPVGFRYSAYYWLPMSLIIFVFAFQQGQISKFLSNKYLFIAGEISYGFYMFHQLVIRYFLKYFPAMFEKEWLVISLMFSIALIISYFSYHYFETPLNRYIRNSAKN